MADLMPWEIIEDIYAQTFKEENPDDRTPISARIAFGALHIKENENFSDERTVEYIAENNYMQYFLGLKEFHSEPLFDASMMTLFRKRFKASDIEKINEELFRRIHKTKDEPPQDGEGGNKGTLVMDATAAPSDVRYPTDLSLLNESRENTEKMIDEVWEKTKRLGHKTAYNRKKAIRQAIGEQLGYVEKNLETLERLLKESAGEGLSKRQQERLETIHKVAEQQREHLTNPKVSIAERIVNLRQPHVRPIVRGKAGVPVEFGQKLAFSVVEGFTFIEEQSWNNFAEGVTLKASAEKYKKRHGSWPEAILADQTYRNRENLQFCKKNGIRLSGLRLGRPKADELEANQGQAYRGSWGRNIVEGRNGLVKRRYGMGRIMAWLSETAKTEDELNVLVMNVAHALRVLLRFWLQTLFFMKRSTSLSEL